jgi:hypothetical protein
MAYRFNRRSFLARITGGAIITGGSLTLLTGAARGQVSDRDPSDPIGHGRGGGSGVTDHDPNDPAGRGRGAGGSTAPSNGVTDRDPNDPSGHGRGGGYSGSPSTGVTDRDPSDPSGYGRGGGYSGSPSTGFTDRDPSDPAGRGRGGGRASQPESEVCAQFRQRIAQEEMLAGSRGYSDGDFQQLYNDMNAVNGLAQNTDLLTSPERRYRNLEQIRGITQRYGIRCSPTDINCQISEMRRLYSTQEQIRNNYLMHHSEADRIRSALVQWRCNR